MLLKELEAIAFKLDLVQSALILKEIRSIDGKEHMVIRLLDHFIVQYG